jgi:hypothetical protein
MSQEPRLYFFPIKQFAYVPPEIVTDAFNVLINDLNSYLSSINFSSGMDLGSFTVAALPGSASEGSRAYATNGRKIGEGPGLGTGVWVYFSGGLWRTLSTDAPVQA